MGQKALAVTFLVAGLCASSVSRADDTIAYRIARGETLIGIGEKYLIRSADYRIVQRSNRIADPYRIRVGTVMHIPRSLLQFTPSAGRLAVVRGQVLVSGRPASAGQIVNEGQLLQTAAGSFVSIALEDGSRISLPSNSQLRITRLRRYLLASALDYDFQVDRGDARSRVVPLKSPHDRYQVRTPKAVSAVRGTEFQTRFDDQGDRDFAEVDEGALAIGLKTGGEVAVGSGNGLSVRPDGSSIKEAMLPPPEIEGAGRLQSDPAVTFAVPSPGAAISGYRIGIATDAGFLDQVRDITVAAPTADVGAIADGKYFFRIRAISANGIEGLPATYAFKRRLNSVKAVAGESDDGWTFKWDGEGQGIIRYHFQLYRGGMQNAAIVDEPALASRAIVVSSLDPDTYYWRVGAAQYADGESSINWTPMEKFVVGAD